MSFRSKMQAGEGRVFYALLLSLAAGFGTWEACVIEPSLCVKFSDTLPKIAFLPAAFSVTAYNLRTRVIDLILKADVSPRLMDQYCVIARDCGKRLTNLVFFFSFVACTVAASGLAPRDGDLPPLLFAGIMAAITAAVVNFIYIIFAFERLERFMLDDAEDRCADKEARRLLNQTPPL